MNFKAVQELTLSGRVGLLPLEPSLWDIFETVWLSGLSCPVCRWGLRPLPGVGQPLPSQPTLTCGLAVASTPTP